MHKVDPMEIMLSDIFDKVFYSQEPRTKVCVECDGEGIIELEVPRPHNVNRDVGVIDVTPVPCEECGGTGEMEVEDE
jgi:DnaJ-class molecular chaperone